MPLSKGTKVERDLAERFLFGVKALDRFARLMGRWWDLWFRALPEIVLR
jgi:hypothetical protein